MIIRNPIAILLLLFFCNFNKKHMKTEFRIKIQRKICNKESLIFKRGLQNIGAFPPFNLIRLCLPSVSTELLNLFWHGIFLSF